MENFLFALKTTANREDQVMDFVEANVRKKNLEVYSLIKAHGMRGYIFMEAKSMEDAQTAFSGVPYAKGILPKTLNYEEISSMIETVKMDSVKVIRREGAEEEPNEK